MSNYISSLCRDVNEKNTVKGYVNYFALRCTILLVWCIILSFRVFYPMSTLPCLDLESSTSWAHTLRWWTWRSPSMEVWQPSFDIWWGDQSLHPLNAFWAESDLFFFFVVSLCILGRTLLGWANLEFAAGYFTKFWEEFSLTGEHTRAGCIGKGSRQDESPWAPLNFRVWSWYHTSEGPPCS